MRAFAQKPKAAQQTKSAKSAIPRRAHSVEGGVVNLLQRSVGNQAVRRLLAARTVNVEGDPTTTDTSRSPHDFSQSRVDSYEVSHPAIQLTKLDGAGPHTADTVTIRADVDAGVPPAKAPATPPSKAPAAPPGKAPKAPDCNYKLTYANEKNLACDAKQARGASIQFDITKVKASGKGCPATLDGLKLTEKVSSDGGCHPQQPKPGEGCTIRADKAKPLEGRFVECTDTYNVCGDDQAFKFMGCTQIITQEIFIGGNPAETHEIKFDIFKRGTKPSGKATRK